MMEYMPGLLLVPIIICVLFLICKWIQYNYEIKILRKKINSIKNRDMSVMNSYTANALSTETNTKNFNEKYGDLLDKINRYIKNAIDKGDYVCHVPVEKDDVRAKELIKHLEGKGYIVNYIELKADEVFNDLRIYWGNK